MGEARDVSEHLLVGALIPFGELDHTVQDEDFPVMYRIEYEHVLEVRSLMKKDLFHLGGTV